MAITHSGAAASRILSSRDGVRVSGSHEDSAKGEWVSESGHRPSSHLLHLMIRKLKLSRIINRVVLQPLLMLKVQRVVRVRRSRSHLRSK